MRVRTCIRNRIAGRSRRILRSTWAWGHCDGRTYQLQRHNSPFLCNVVGSFVCLFPSNAIKHDCHGSKLRVNVLHVLSLPGPLCTLVPVHGRSDYSVDFPWLNWIAIPSWASGLASPVIMENGSLYHWGSVNWPLPRVGLRGWSRNYVNRMF